MGQPVVHFEVIGNDGDKLRSYYSQLFGWEIDASNPMNYGTVDREANLTPEGVGIGGGVAGYEQTQSYVTFYVQVPDVEAALQQAEELGGSRVMGPEEVPGAGITLGQLKDPEGHLIGVIQSS